MKSKSSSSVSHTSPWSSLYLPSRNGPSFWCMKSASWTSPVTYVASWIRSPPLPSLLCTWTDVAGGRGRRAFRMQRPDTLALGVTSDHPVIHTFQRTKESKLPGAMRRILLSKLLRLPSPHYKVKSKILSSIVTQENLKTWHCLSKMQCNFLCEEKGIYIYKCRIYQINC